MAQNENYVTLRKKVPKNTRLAMLNLKERADDNLVLPAHSRPAAEDQVMEFINRHGMVWGPFSFIFTREKHPDGEYLHLSVANVERYPSWDELMIFRSVFFDDKMEVFQVLPPIDEYVNVHEHCFHLWHKKESTIIFPH